jgi:hypothetical protein
LLLGILSLVIDAIGTIGGNRRERIGRIGWNRSYRRERIG